MYVFTSLIQHSTDSPNHYNMARITGSLERITVYLFTDNLIVYIKITRNVQNTLRTNEFSKVLREKIIIQIESYLYITENM